MHGVPTIPEKTSRFQSNAAPLGREKRNSLGRNAPENAPRNRFFAN
jgi:hypothetical protein